MIISPHFHMRVAERCPPGTDADLLASNIAFAIRNDMHGLIERVMPAQSSDGRVKRTIWRVRISGESIYVVVCDKTQRAITVLTQEQFAVTKAARKANRRRETLEAIRMEEENQKHGRARIVRLRKQGGIRR